MSALFALVQLLVALLALWGFYSQIVRPMFRRERLFPFFRKESVPSLEEVVRQEQEKIKIIRLRKQAANLRKNRRSK